MFDDMTTYLIFTGQIMGGNVLYIIILPQENTWILGKEGNID